MKTIFIIGRKKEYFYSVESKCVQPYEWNKKMLLVKKICKLFRCAIPERYLNKDIYDADKVIITDGIFSLSLLLSLKKMYNTEKIYLYYMNVIDENNIKYLDYFKKENIYTFDKSDSKKYLIEYMHTPYSNKICKKKSDIKYDTVFLGREKGRHEEIDRLYKYFCDMKLKPKFMVLDSKNSNYKINSYIDYFTYLNFISRSKSILEINMSNQDGCTLRYMESLFLGKKLITNNEKILEDEYYDPNNVFVIGRDSDSRLFEFLNTPSAKIESLYKLEFNYWIEKFGYEDK